MPGVVFFHFDLVIDFSFDGSQVGQALFRAEGQSRALLAGPAGAADAVDVVVRFVGQVEVDDVRDTLDVDAPSRDVGGHEDTNAAGLEPVEGSGACALTLVAVDGSGTDTILRQLPCKSIGSVLGPGKNQGPVNIRRQERHSQQILLFFLLFTLEELNKVIVVFQLFFVDNWITAIILGFNHSEMTFETASPEPIAVTFYPIARVEGRRPSFLIWRERIDNLILVVNLLLEGFSFLVFVLFKLL